MATNRFCSRMVRPVAAPQLRQMVEASKANPKATLFVKFASAFCSACQESRKSIDTALKATDKCLDIVELDADVADTTADSFGVKEMPTLVAMKGGKVVGKMIGASEPQAYVRFFHKHTN
jgi:thioredoxin-like negative regulator of GroEL